MTFSLSEVMFNHFFLLYFISDSKRPFQQGEPLLSWTPSKSLRLCSRSLLLQCFNDANNRGNALWAQMSVITVTASSEHSVIHLCGREREVSEKDSVCASLC